MGQCEHSAHTSPFMTVIIHTLNSTFSTAFIQSHDLLTMFDSADQRLFEGRNRLIFSEELRCCIPMFECRMMTETSIVFPILMYSCMFLCLFLPYKKKKAHLEFNLTCRTKSETIPPPH